MSSDEQHESILRAVSAATREVEKGKQGSADKPGKFLKSFLRSLAIAGFSVGIGVLIYSCSLAQAPAPPKGPPSGQPMCDGQVMQPDEVCDVDVNGSHHTDTYADRVQQAQSDLQKYQADLQTYQADLQKYPAQEQEAGADWPVGLGLLLGGLFCGGGSAFIGKRQEKRTMRWLSTPDRSAWTKVEINPRSFPFSWPRVCICCAIPTTPNHPHTFELSFGSGRNKVVQKIKTQIPYCGNCLTHIKEPVWNLGCLPMILLPVLSFVTIITVIQRVNAEAVQDHAWPFIVAFFIAVLSLCLSVYLSYAPRIRKAEDQLRTHLTQRCSFEALAVGLTRPSRTASYFFSFANRQYAELFLQANASRAATAPAQQSGSGNTLIDSKGYDEVMAAYDRAIALEPANAAYRNRLGVALFNQKRHTEALAAFDKSVALDSSNAAYHNWRGLALLNLKRYQEALAAFDKALALESSSATYRSNREAALRALNLSSKAPVNAGSSAGAAAPAPAQRSGSGNTALPTSQPTQAATTRAGFQTFTSSDNSFRIAYPGDWQQKAASSGIGATFTSPDQQKVFTITAANPGTSSADPAAVVVAACSGVDGTPSSPEPVRIGGQSWTEAECDTSKYGSNIHFVAEAVLYKGNMFLIIYTSPKESFESIARQFFTPMEQSFQFLS